MQSFLISITKKINLNAGRSGRIFGARYHWSLIENEQYYDCALKYIYRNPVKANLAMTAEEYPHSTLRYVLEDSFPYFSIDPPVGHANNIPNNDALKYLIWLNRPFSNEQQIAIKGGFRKTHFVPTRIGWKKGEKTLNGLRYQE